MRSPRGRVRGPVLGMDVSKARDPDGIGTWQREVWRALEILLENPSPPSGDPTPELIPFDDSEAGPAPGQVDIFLSSAWSVPPFHDGSSIFVVHDLTFLSHPTFHTRQNRLRCTEGLIRAHLTGRTRFVAVSRATARELERFLGPIDVEVVANGVDPRWRTLPAQEVAERLRSRLAELAPGLVSASPATSESGVPEMVLFVGSFEPRKNLPRLHSAHRRLPGNLRRRHPLVVAGGQGWHSEEVLRHMEEDPHAWVLGPMERDLLLDLYNAATLFVYPSLAEGFGLPVAEALACGTPVLTSSTSSLPEVAGDAARLVDPEDLDALSSALESLLRDPEERRRLASLGPRRARRFTWRAAADRLLQLALSSLSRPSPA